MCLFLFILTSTMFDISVARRVLYYVLYFILLNVRIILTVTVAIANGRRYLQ